MMASGYNRQYPQTNHSLKCIVAGKRELNLKTMDVSFMLVLENTVYLPYFLQMFLFNSEENLYIQYECASFRML